MRRTVKLWLKKVKRLIIYNENSYVGIEINVPISMQGIEAANTLDMIRCQAQYILIAGFFGFNIHKKIHHG